MAAFHWNSCFVTGLTEVDNQHHHLVDIINRFGALVMRQEGASIAELESVFVELAAYARYHFAEEEASMYAMGLDARHIEEHRRSHASFLDEVTTLHGSISANNRNAAKFLLQFLTYWLVNHVIKEDLLMKPFLTKRSPSFDPR